MTIKPIETRYAGYRFRSRLEARWAVAFTTSNLIPRWEYEPEGFQTPAGPYLPDFRIWWTSSDYGWIEIKPDNYQPTVRDEQVYRALARTAPAGLVLLRGIGAGYRLYHPYGHHIDNSDPFLEETAVIAGRSARFEHGQAGA